MKKIMISLVLVFCLCLCGCEAEITDDGQASEKMTVTFFDVGKADAILIQTDHSVVMIDTGTADVAEPLAEKLTDMGIMKIDLLILSHFDQDHVGGAATIIERIAVDKVLMTYESKESDEIDAFFAAVKQDNVSTREISKVTEFTLDGVSYTIIPPEKKDYGNDTSNDSSLVVRALFGETSYLFAGDVEKARIKELVKGGYDLSATVLKMPHHGGIEDNTEKLVTAVWPKYAVITSSEDEPEDKETVKILEALGVDTYLTRKGTVVMISDGKTITIKQ